jgi:hypothetical protein
MIVEDGFGNRIGSETMDADDGGDLSQSIYTILDTKSILSTIL